MKSAHQWTFPLVIRMKRHATLPKGEETVTLILPSISVLPSGLSVGIQIEVPRYNSKLKERPLIDFIKEAKPYLVRELNNHLMLVPSSLATLDDMSHRACALGRPDLYAPDPDEQLYKEKVTVRMSELDFDFCCPCDTHADKQRLADSLVKEILDDERVARDWMVVRTPDVGITMMRDGLELTLSHNEVYVRVSPSSETYEILFGLWDTVRLYSALQRRRFRHYRAQLAKSHENEAMSTLYAMRSMAQQEKSRDAERHR